MSKKNLFNKIFNKSVLSITKRIESFFNFFKENISYKKFFLASFKTVDKRIFFAAAIIFITVISYFLIPSFYDKSKVKVKLENQILDQYNLEVKFDQSFRYGLFPKPHFYSKDTIISHKSSNIAKSKNTKVFISVKNFFSSDNLKIKNLIFKQTEFRIDNLNFNFFINLLGNNKSNHEINFLNSKLFYLDRNEDIIFLSNIKNLNYLYQDNLLKKFNSKLNIFNIPINLEATHNTIKKTFFTELSSYPLRLNIKNYSNYDDEKLDGQFDLTLINQSRKIDYSLKNNSLNFKTKDDTIDGDINIKPFFLHSSLKFYQIDLKNIFKDTSIFFNILQSEILNNKNLNGKINIDINRFKGVNFLNEIKSNILLEEGDIFIKNLRTTFKDSVNINLSDTQLIVNNNNLNLSGYIAFDFVDINDFYAHYQINKKDRKDIKRIKFGFFFNLDEKIIEIDNLKVDGSSNQNLDKFLNDFNFKKEDIFNKIIFRNSLKDFFRNY